MAILISTSAAQEAKPRPKLPLEFPAPQYVQEIKVTFATPQAAKQAAVKITPLFDGREWAVTSRWDDNHPGAIPMHDCLAKHGHSGTFYLNGLYGDWSTGTPELNSDWGRQLIEKGASIGCHSLTHPNLGFCSRNRMFQETLGDRMQWEAAVDQPVMSYSFSYCSFTNVQEGLAVQADVMRVLERAGFFNIANEAPVEDIDTGLTLSPIMPSDGADIDPFAEAALKSPVFKEAHPVLCYSMHPWYDTPEKWARFEAQLDKYGHREDWWYCNNNQYGAYRYQFKQAKLQVSKPQGNTVTVRLERPMLLDLNDPTPLTLEVSGVKPEEIASVKCATADIKPSTRKAGLFQAYHDRGQALPRKIGMVPMNYTNRKALGGKDYDSDFPNLHALLHFEDGKLKLQMDNKGKSPLSHVRLTYRLPLMWKEGVVRKDVSTVVAGKSFTDTFRPTLAQKDLRFTTGRGFYEVQIDFVQDGQPGRLHVGCITDTNTQNDLSYPFQGFLMLGPFAPAQLDQDKFAKDLAGGKNMLCDWVLGDQRKMSWQIDNGLREKQTDVEMVPLTVDYARDPGTCVLATTVISPKAQKVGIRYYNGLTRIFLNNREVTRPPSQDWLDATIELQAGRNNMVILTTEWGGFFIRLTKPGTQERLLDLQYERPKLPSDPKQTYVPAPASGAPAQQVSLAGDWKGVLVHAMPASTHDAKYKDKGISPEARKLLGADVDASSWVTLPVPAFWGTYGGQWGKSDGEAVFQKVIELPADWQGKDLTLSLGAIDDFDDTFFNGVLVGRIDDRALDAFQRLRQYVVPGKLVKAGKNVVTVRIFDRFGDGGFWSTATELYLMKKA